MLTSTGMPSGARVPRPALYGGWGLVQPRSEICVTTEPAGVQALVDVWFSRLTPFANELPLSDKAVLLANGHEPADAHITLGPEPYGIQPPLRPLRAAWADDAPR